MMSAREHGGLPPPLHRLILREEFRASRSAGSAVSGSGECVGRWQRTLRQTKTKAVKLPMLRVRSGSLNMNAPFEPAGRLHPRHAHDEVEKRWMVGGGGRTLK